MVANLSPNFEARFSRIDLTPAAPSAAPSSAPRAPPRPPRKTYPHLFPSTPSKPPVLSTATRAESRNKASTRATAASASAQTATSSVPTAAPQRRGASQPHLASFMRGTSSSSQKQVAAAAAAAGRPPVRRNLSGTLPAAGGSKRQLRTKIAKVRDVPARPGPVATATAPEPRRQPREPSAAPETQPGRRAPPRAPETRREPRAPSAPGSTPAAPSDITNFSLDRKRPAPAPAPASRLPHSHSVHALGSNVPDRVAPRKASAPRLQRSGVARGLAGMTKVQTLGELYAMIQRQDPELFCGDDSATDACEEMPVVAAAAGTGASSLSIYERGEVLRKRDIYYIPRHRAAGGDGRTINIKNYGDNFGFDDASGNYFIVPGDHINYRYEIAKVLGNGSFGNVVECRDHKWRRKSSCQSRGAGGGVKIIKNDLNWSLQAVYEIKMLKHLNEHGGSPQILRYLSHFHFRGHMCIATEVLSLNLFSLLEISAFKGFAMPVLRPLTTQILRGLDFIHAHDVIHCDIKPENIMVRLPQSRHDALCVKIIDFGSSCFKHEISYSYIQSRYYRAPEVVLGAKYNHKIDIWSFGCVVAELYTGTPLLPGRSELEQIAMMLEVFGAPSSQLVLGYRRALMAAARAPAASAPGARAMPRLDERSIKRTLVYSLFDADGKINMQFLNLRLQALGGARRSVKLNSKVLEVMLKIGAGNDKADGASFVKMLKGVFQWDPSQRSSAAELLQCAFITDANRRAP